MDSSINNEVAHEFPPFIRVFKDGRIERLTGTNIVPASLDPKTGVQSKDVVYSSDSNLSVRLYLPKSVNPDQRLPVLVYFHGGGFIVETAFSPTYHNHLNPVVAAANCIAVSVDYRRAPEHPLPFAYDDSWTSLKWVASHVDGNGPEEWLNRYADFDKVFMAGDSAGANIAHHMAVRYGHEKLAACVNLAGMILVHPYFWGKEPIGSEATNLNGKAFVEGLWRIACPTTTGLDDLLLNPAFDPKLASLGCSKVLVFVAEKDLLRERGYYYVDILKKSGWAGEVEILKANEEEHVFHLFKPTSEGAVALLNRIVSFINQQDKP